MFDKISRRSFLRGVGGAAVSLPFLEIMRPRRAVAQSMAVPKRIVFFQTPNGMQMDSWRCNIRNQDPTDFDLSPVLAPLAEHKDRLLILDGVSMSSSYDREQQATAHQGGAASIWTGTWAGPGQMDGGGNLLSGYATSHSLDHELASNSAVTAGARFPAYYFGVLPSNDHVISRMFYAGRDQPIGPNANPYDVHRQIFTDLSSTNQELVLKKREGGAVLDAVLGDYRDLRCQLGSADRETLERHITHVEEIERQLQALSVDMGRHPECAAPDLGEQINYFNYRLLPQLGRLQMDMLAMSLTCDLTRVAALQWHSPVGAIIHEWLGHTETHHDITHQPESDTAAQQRLREINTWYGEQFNYLLNRMHSIVEANGKTLLENSVVIWATEIATGWNHDRREMPLVLAGGCQDYFATGRCVRYTDRPAHNRLHLGLLDAMGVPATTFGAAEYCAGGILPGLSG